MMTGEPAEGACGVMDDLATWLRAQLDEDEREANEDDPVGTCDGGPGVHLTRERALAEVEAKRRILDEVVDEANGLDAQVDGEFRVGRRDESIEPYIGDVLVRLLALPYADQPGYRDAWKPGAAGMTAWPGTGRCISCGHVQHPPGSDEPLAGKACGEPVDGGFCTCRQVNSVCGRPVEMTPRVLSAEERAQRVANPSGPSA